eukprot:886131-Heterocapsa_arctica.AAC.1
MRSSWTTWISISARWDKWSSNTASPQSGLQTVDGCGATRCLLSGLGWWWKTMCQSFNLMPIRVASRSVYTLC